MSQKYWKNDENIQSVIEREIEGRLRVESWYGKKVRSKHNVVLFLFCCFFFYFFLFHMCLFFLNSAVKNLINSFAVLKINTKTPVASCFRDIGNFVSI